MIAEQAGKQDSLAVQAVNIFVGAYGAEAGVAGGWPPVLGPSEWQPVYEGDH